MKTAPEVVDKHGRHPLRHHLGLQLQIDFLPRVLLHFTLHRQIVQLEVACVVQ